MGYMGCTYFELRGKRRERAGAVSAGARPEIPCSPCSPCSQAWVPVQTTGPRTTRSAREGFRERLETEREGIRADEEVVAEIQGVVGPADQRGTAGGVAPTSGDGRDTR